MKGYIHYSYAHNATTHSLVYLTIHDLQTSLQLLFQSLHQINVAQRHCVPTSFCPLGPIGLGQTKNWRPQFTPGFFVVKVTQGSPCSQRGAGFLEKSFVQVSLEASWEARGSESKGSVDGGGGEGRGAVSMVVDWLAGSVDVEGEADGGGALFGGLGSGGLLRVWKKPLSDCWPLVFLDVVAGALDLPRLTALAGDPEAEARRFSADLRGLCDDGGLPFVLAYMSALEASSASSRSLSMLSSVLFEVLTLASAEGLGSVTVGIGVVVALGATGFMLNMSRMFLLLVNSLSSLPLRGGTSLTTS